MPKKRNGVCRRDFIRSTALLSGGLAAVGVPGAARGQAAGGAAPPKLGAQLIGKLEGPELILDPAKWPKKFSRGADAGRAGEAGQAPAGGQARARGADGHQAGPRASAATAAPGGAASPGPGDGENGNRIVSADKILFWEYTGRRSGPASRAQWMLSDDGKSVTIYLRKGISGRTAQPFTANDFVFWYEDVYLNKDLVPTPHPDFMINGKSGVDQEDRRRRRSSSSSRRPNYLFLDILAGSAPPWAAARPLWQMSGRTMGAYMPAHYIKQFHPKYIGQGRGGRQGQGRGLRRLGGVHQEPLGLAAQPRAARPDALEDGDAHQQPDLGDGAQPVLLRGGHRGQPASVHRPHPDDRWPRTSRC